MRTFVINLARAHDRRAVISNQLNDLGVDFEIWPAVDGRMLTDVDHDKFREEHPTYHYSRASNEGINAWVGCTRSHQTLCQHIFDTWDGPALVLEDDAELSSDWYERSAEALDRFQDAELLLVGSSIWPRSKFTTRVYKPRLIHAYIITTREMAQELATVWKDESTEGDEVWWKIMKDHPTYALQPPAARQATGVSYITGMPNRGPALPEQLGIVTLAKNYLAGRGL